METKFEKWAQSVNSIFDDNGKKAIAFVIASIFKNVIFENIGFYPILYIECDTTSKNFYLSDIIYKVLGGSDFAFLEKTGNCHKLANIEFYKNAAFGITTDKTIIIRGKDTVSDIPLLSRCLILKSDIDSFANPLIDDADFIKELITYESIFEDAFKHYYLLYFDLLSNKKNWHKRHIEIYAALLATIEIFETKLPFSTNDFLEIIL